MTEEQYQLGIRDLSKHELITLVTVYRNELKSCNEIFKDFAVNNFAQNVWHKVICAIKLARVQSMIEDYKVAIKGK